MEQDRVSEIVVAMFTTIQAKGQFDPPPHMHVREWLGTIGVDITPDEFEEMSPWMAFGYLLGKLEATTTEQPLALEVVQPKGRKKTDKAAGTDPLPQLLRLFIELDIDPKICEPTRRSVDGMWYRVRRIEFADEATLNKAGDAMAALPGHGETWNFWRPAK